MGTLSVAGSLDHAAVNDDLRSCVHFEHRGAQIEITGVLLHDSRVLLTAQVMPFGGGKAWTDFWVTPGAGTNPLPAAMTGARDRICGLVEFLHIPETSGA